MNYLVCDIFTNYLIVNNLFNYLSIFKINKETKTIIDNNLLFQRKKSVILLNKLLSSNGYDYNIISGLLTPTNGVLNTDKVDLDCRNHFTDVLGSIIDLYFNGCDKEYEKYKKNFYNYKNDCLDPFCRLKNFWRNKIKNRMKESILLNMALSHADYEYSIIKGREL